MNNFFDQSQGTRSAHLIWAKERAKEQIDKGMPLAGWISFRSDMSKHPNLRDHPALQFGDYIAGWMIKNLMEFPADIPGIGSAANLFLILPGPMNMAKFIEGFK